MNASEIQILKGANRTSSVRMVHSVKGGHVDAVVTKAHCREWPRRRAGGEPESYGPSLGNLLCLFWLNLTIILNLGSFI
jgi:hypothetical protein